MKNVFFEISRLKLLSSGLVLEGSKNLQCQRITNNSLVLAILLPTDANSQKVNINSFYF